MESGLLRDILGNFSTQGERYYFRMEGACQVDVRWEWPCKVRMVMQGDYYMVEGTTQHTTWGGCKMRMAMWGENGHVRWILHGGGDNLTHNMRWMQDENGHTRWDLQSHLASMWDNFATSSPYIMAKLSHVDVRWLWVDVTLATSKVQMMNISINFPLYTFAKSPCIHARQLCHLAHVRWQIYKVTLCPSETTVTSCPCKMAKLSHVDARWLLCGRGGNLTHNVRWTRGENGHARWDLQSHLASTWDSSRGTSHLVKFFIPWYFLLVPPLTYHICGVTNSSYTPDFVYWWHLAMVSKPGWIPMNACFIMYAMSSSDSSPPSAILASLCSDSQHSR